ncbi:MAG: metallophosphoesterase family protein [Elusimicrobia bacterium]|nr:metallophosphoesterase family protein [Elusimicrobiota bacterium]
MKIGLISDTHRNIDYLTEAVERMINDYGIETLVFLGDECEDIDAVKDMFKKVIWVPGIFCQHYKDKNIAHRSIKEFNGVKVLITHTPSSHPNDFSEDIKPENITKKEVNMVFYGHTHIPKIEEKAGIIWVNPGHLKVNDKRGASPSFGIIDFKNKTIKIIDFKTDREILKKSFS